MDILVKDYISYLHDSINNEKRSLSSILSSNTPCLNISMSDFAHGYLSDESWNSIASLLKKEDKTAYSNWIKTEKEKPNLVSVVMAPLVYKKKYLLGAPISSNKEDDIYPILINICINPATRKLNFSDDTFPFVPREYLYPNDTSIYEMLSTTEKVDACYAQYNNRLIEWKDLLNNIKYLHRNAFDLKDEKVHIPNYVLSKEFSLMAFCELKEGTTRSLERLFDHIENSESKTSSFPVFEELLNSNTVVKSYHDLDPVLIDEDKQFESLVLHLSQMEPDYGLSLSQRETLAHFLSRETVKPVFAIDGPPGTGKTTLLLSIIASLWTRNAYNELDPPLIVGTSANNQAITNILEAFAKAQKKSIFLSENLTNRWIPDLKSYGLYMTNKNDDIKYNFDVYKLSSNGDISFPEEKIYEQQNYFMKCFQDWCHEENYLSLDGITLLQMQKVLHNELTNKVDKLILYNKNMHTIIKTLPRFSSNGIQLSKNGYSFNEVQLKIKNYLNYFEDKNKEFYDKTEKLKNFHESFISYIKQIPFITGILNKVGMEYFKNKYINKYIVSQKDYSIAEIQSYKTEIEWFQVQINSLQKESVFFTEQRENLKKINMFFEKCISDITSFYKHKNKTFDMNKKFIEEMESFLDVTYRFETFLYTTHYYEAGYLLDTEKELQKRKRKNFNQAWDFSLSKPNHLKRFSKIFPCLISTLHSLPTYMKWDKDYLFGKVDLIIMDETGQVPPQLGMPASLFAKKILCVGDVDQIPPIYKTEKELDKITAFQNNLIKDFNDFENGLLSENGLLVSNGNMMRLAQNATEWCKFPKERGGGLFLEEHRRCYNEIINICNDLCYRDKLKPLRDQSKRKIEEVPLRWINIESDGSGMVGVNHNDVEAKHIALWIKNNKTKLLESYRIKGNIPNTQDFGLKDIVAIVTPFKRQEKTLKENLFKILGANDSRGIIVGTVHSLQGAEKAIVIFSPTYGKGQNPATAFYNREKSIINVAVSRAKDCFMVFGNMCLFKVGKDSLASTVLANHLFSNDNYEIDISEVLDEEDVEF